MSEDRNRHPFPGSSSGSSSDLTEDVLRQALMQQALAVEVAPDALSSIRRRVSRRTRQRRTITMSLATVATGAVATVTAVVVGLGSCVPAPSPGPVPGSPDVSPTAPGPTHSASPPTGVPARVPVYFVGVVRAKPVLYREFRPVSLAEDTLPARITAALDVMLRGSPLDPDYASSWPASASVLGVEVSGAVAVVDLGGATVNPIDSAGGLAAVQQLVWTVTAVAADHGEPLTGVRLLFDGASRSTLWGSTPVSGTLVRGSSAQALAPVWLISPQQGDTVGRTFDVHVSGTVFEATAQLRVRNSAGAVVQERIVQLSIGAPSRGEAHLPVTLAPGSYTLEAFYFSPEDGSVQGLDNHTITVLSR